MLNRTQPSALRQKFSDIQGEVLIQIVDFPICSKHFTSPKSLSRLRSVSKSQPWHLAFHGWGTLIILVTNAWCITSSKFSSHGDDVTT